MKVHNHLAKYGEILDDGQHSDAAWLRDAFGRNPRAINDLKHETDRRRAAIETRKAQSLSAYQTDVDRIASLRRQLDDKVVKFQQEVDDYKERLAKHQTAFAAWKKRFEDWDKSVDDTGGLLVTLRELIHICEDGLRFRQVRPYLPTPIE